MEKKRHLDGFVPLVSFFALNPSVKKKGRGGGFFQNKRKWGFGVFNVLRCQNVSLFRSL